MNDNEAYDQIMHALDAVYNCGKNGCASACAAMTEQRSKIYALFTKIRDDRDVAQETLSDRNRAALDTDVNHQLSLAALREERDAAQADAAKANQLLERETLAATKARSAYEEALGRLHREYQQTNATSHYERNAARSEAVKAEKALAQRTVCDQTVDSLHSDYSKSITALHAQHRREIEALQGKAASDPLTPRIDQLEHEFRSRLGQIDVLRREIGSVRENFRQEMEALRPKRSLSSELITARMDKFELDLVERLERLESRFAELARSK